MKTTIVKSINMSQKFKHDFETRTKICCVQAVCSNEIATFRLAWSTQYKYKRRAQQFFTRAP